MSSTVWWALAASVFIALIVMVTAFIVMKIKIKKIKDSFDEYQDNSQNLALEREGHGVLLWDEKEKAKNPIDDFELEFIINTIWRNKYKNIKLVNCTEYENKSLTKLANIKVEYKGVKTDVILFKNSKNYIQDFEANYELLNLKGIMFFADLPFKNFKVIKFKKYLKSKKIRFDHEKYGKGIIIIAKI